MKIKKLHIENFGKLFNYDLEFNDQINEVYKENGWGKSTLTAFIKAMFYSMPARARGDEFKFERTKFSPWQGGKYGGFLEYESDGKIYRVTRYFERTPETDYFELKDLQTNKVLTYEDERLGDVLFGLGRESFEVTALFPQLNFISSSTIQITANLTGLNKFKNDIENLNKAEKILEAKMSAVKKEKPKKEELDTLKKKMIENETYINEEKEKLVSLKDKLETIKTDEKSINEKLIDENKQFEYLSHAFNQKVTLQEELNKESEKLNKVLNQTNIIKDEKLEKRGQNKNKRIKYFIPIPFVIVSLILLIFTAFGIVNLVVGIVATISLLALAVVADVLVIKLKRDKNLYDNIRDLDKELKKSEDEAKGIQKNIASINEQIKLFSGVNAPNRQNLEEFEEKSTQIKLERLSLENEIVNITENIDRLIELNEKLQNDYDLMFEKMSNVDEKLNILQTTRDYLLNAKDNVSSRFVVPVNEKLKGILSKFNFSDREFVVDTSWNVKENTNYGTKDFEYSSQGLQDIISFCQRINLIQEVYQKEKPIIILDDTFVNFDDANIAIAKQMVQEISKDYQILYICCNQRCSIVK